MAEIEKQIRKSLASQVPGLKQGSPTTESKASSPNDSSKGKKDPPVGTTHSIKAVSDQKDGAKSEKDKKIDAVVKLFDASKGSSQSDKAQDQPTGAREGELKKQIAERQEVIAKL